MSVKELSFITNPADMHVSIEDNKVRIQVVDLDGLAIMLLDRNQAHLLMLYLQEHLGYKPAMQNYKESWYCDKCKIYHSKDHTCVRIST